MKLALALIISLFVLHFLQRAEINELRVRMSAVELNCMWVGGEEMVCP